MMLNSDTNDYHEILIMINGMNCDLEKCPLIQFWHYSACDRNPDTPETRRFEILALAKCQQILTLTIEVTLANDTTEITYDSGSGLSGDRVSSRQLKND